MLTIESLTVSYRRVPAVTDLSLHVEEGEFVGIIGPNGAGKSTTLKAIFGLVKPRSGDITFEGKSLRGKAPEDIARSGLALVPEGRHIFGSLTVAENLSLGYASGRRPDARHRDEVLDRFPVLRKYHSAPASGLSGGEQQQLAIARALLSRPRIMLLDEPSLGLAPRDVAEVLAVLSELNAAGTTILLVEQNANATIETAGRSYVISGGRIIASGTAGELSSTDEIRAAYLGRAV